jgi:signal transduction histidine kinase
MLRALSVVRVVVLGFAVAVNVVTWERLSRPWVAGIALAVMAAWTAVASWAYDRPRRRGPALLGTDLGLAVGLILLTLAVLGPAQRAEHLSTLPSFWVMAAVLAWGVHWGWPGGLVAAAAVSAADLAIRTEVSQTNIGNIFLLMIGGPVVGYTTGLLKQMAAARARAEREAARAGERARLARVVHDGVLQVLALVQRQGRELGGEAAELGRLAGEQEVALRRLVQQESRTELTQRTSTTGSGLPGADPGARHAVGGREGEHDLASALTALESATVTVSAPALPVALPPDQVGELCAVVRAALDNVTQHVGAEAPAWVLLEDLGACVVVTVRDAGPGIPPGRLAAAAAEGRLGVSESICGRLRDLGGTATLVTAPGQGTEWDLRLPRARHTQRVTGRGDRR